MRVLVDVDGVVADTTSCFLSALSDATGKKFHDADVTDWDFRKCLGISEDEERAAWDMFYMEYIADAREYRGAVDAVRELAQNHEVIFVTAPSPHLDVWVGFRDRWLEARFPGVPVIHTKHKHLIHGDALIDDRYDNIASWCRAHPAGIGVLWGQPWNTKHAGYSTLPYARTSDWNVVAKLLSPPRLADESDSTRIAVARCP